MDKMISGKFLLRAAAVLFALFIVASLAILAIFGPRYGVYLLPPSPQQYTSDTIAYMDYGLYASTDEWAEARAEALAKAETVGSYEEAHAILEEAIKVAGGKHSAVVTEPSSAAGGADAQITGNCPVFMGEFIHRLVRHSQDIFRP